MRFNTSGVRPAAPKILVVDDDSDVREALVGALEDEGYAVTEAKDGLDALERLKLERLKRATLPQLIILDLNMPRCGGPDFRRASLKEPELGAVPLLVVSADPDAGERATAMGAQAFLPKPVSLLELFATVARLLTPGRKRAGEA